MEKDIRFYLIVCLIAVCFVCGLKVGENHTLRHQQITVYSDRVESDMEGQAHEYYLDYGE